MLEGSYHAAALALLREYKEEDDEITVGALMEPIWKMRVFKDTPGC